MRCRGRRTSGPTCWPERDDAAAAHAAPLSAGASRGGAPGVSAQARASLSPGLAALTLNCRKGFLDTAVPHSAFITGSPFSRATTSWMCQAGTGRPAVSLRWPLSISCFISARTVAPAGVARRRISVGWPTRSGVGSAVPPQPPSVIFTSLLAESTRPSSSTASATTLEVSCILRRMPTVGSTAGVRSNSADSSVGLRSTPSSRRFTPGAPQPKVMGTTEPSSNSSGVCRITSLLGVGAGRLSALSATGSDLASKAARGKPLTSSARAAGTAALASAATSNSRRRNRLTSIGRMLSHPQ